MKRNAKGQFVGKQKRQHSIGGKQTHMDGPGRKASDWGTPRERVSRHRRPRRPLVPLD